MTTQYKQAKQRRDEILEQVRITSEALKNFPHSDNGLVPDVVRATAEYQAASLAYRKAFHALQTFNTTYVKTFKDEIRADRYSTRVSKA